MIPGTFGHQPVDPDIDTDLIADGLGDLIAELRGYAEQAPAPRAGLASRVLVALREEAAERREVTATPPRTPLLSRLGFGLRPASFRSLLAAAALVVALGAGAVFAANGRLPFDLPRFGPPATLPVEPTDAVSPGDAIPSETTDASEDADVDTTPSPSEDLDTGNDDDEDKDAEDDDSSSDDDEDADEHDGDQDADEHDGDEDKDAEDDDSGSDDDQDAEDGDSGSGDEADDGEGGDDGSTDDGPDDSSDDATDQD